MGDYWSDNIYPILNLLAKKINPNCKGWREDVSGIITCHICGSTTIFNGTDEIRAHGTQHLKERNLIPFL